MKIAYAIIFLVLFSTVVYAQRPDSAIAKVSYNFVHVRDTNNRDKPYKETMTLLLGRNASVYRSMDKQMQEEMMAEQIRSQIKTVQNPNAVDLTLTGLGATNKDEYYQYVNDKTLYTEQNLINYYLIEEPMPAIDWKIQKDTMSFGPLHCQKATANFRGRDYEAWFCADLPFHNGPWKLWGLPGLILEAHDAKKEVEFKFAGFEEVTKLHQIIVPPADDIKTSPEKLERLKEARIKDPAGFNKAAHGSGQARRSSPMDLIAPQQIHSINIRGGQSGNTNIVNNPLEAH